MLQNFFSGSDQGPVMFLFRLLYFPSGHISLKVPNVEFDFDACVDSIQFLTHTSKT